MSKKYIGIDIGTFNIKIADIIVSKNSVMLDNPLVIRTPKYFIQGGRITDKEEFTALIKQEMARRKVKTGKALVVLNDSIVITRDMEIPAAKPKELAQVVKMNASEYLPGDIGEYAIRHRTLIPAKRNPKNLNYMLMASIKNDLSADIYESLNKAGLKPVMMDVSVHCMIKYLKKAWDEISSKNANLDTVALIDFGATTAKLAIIQDGMPAFLQLMNHSSQKIDVMIANSLDIEREQAEDYKIKYGLKFMASNDNDELMKNVGNIIINQVDLMLNDIYRYINNYAERPLSKPVKHIWLTGGLSGLEGLSYYIQEAFSIPCSIVQVNETVNFKGKRGQSFNFGDQSDQLILFTNIAGAAIRGDL